jgi:hypothetical protein
MFAREYPTYNLGGLQHHVGVQFGKGLRLKAELGAMDERFYNLHIHPSAPTTSAAFTLSAGMSYTVPLAGRKPAPPPRLAAPPAPPSGGGSFDTRLYWRGVGFGALASILGMSAGAALGATLDDGEHYILEPETLLALGGAVISVPIGSAFGVLSDPRGERGSRAVLGTLAGTLAGFGAGALLAPVTLGLNLWLLTPLGSAMGYRRGSLDIGTASAPPPPWRPWPWERKGATCTPRSRGPGPWTRGAIP